MRVLDSRTFYIRTFSNLHAHFLLQGGGVLVALGTDAVFIDCTITGNQAENASDHFELAVAPLLHSALLERYDPNDMWQGGGVTVNGRASFTACVISANAAAINVALAF